ERLPSHVRTRARVRRIHALARERRGGDPGCLPVAAVAGTIAGACGDQSAWPLGTACQRDEQARGVAVAASRLPSAPTDPRGSLAVGDTTRSLQKHLISIAFPLTRRRIDRILPRLATASLSQQYRRTAPFADQ